MTFFTKPSVFKKLNNPIIVSILILFLFMPMSLLAKNYVSLSSSKEGKKYKNHASIIDLEQNKETIKVDLGVSYKFPGNFFDTSDLSHKYYYHQTSKNEAILKVFDANTLTLKYTAKIGTLDYVLLDYQAISFIDVSPDLSKLYVQTRKNKVRSIMVFDNQTGALLKQLSLLKGKSYSYLSNNSEYIITKYTTKHILSIYDANNFEKITEFKSKSRNRYVANYQDFIFKNVFVKYRNKKNTYKIEILNLKTMEKTRLDFISNGKPTYVNDEKNNRIYIAVKDIKSSELILMEFSGGQLTSIETQGVKIKPKNVINHEDSSKLLIIGKRNNLLLDLSGSKENLLMDQPFDTANTIWNPINNQLFLREGSGSEVALYDTKSGKKINRSGTGRAGVKFGKFMASVAFSVVQYNIGYVGFAYGRTSTEMMLNNNKDKLYVINSKTNDVTQFNASDLSDRKALATGSGTALIFQHQDFNDSLFVLSSKKASIISDKDFTMTKQIKFDNVLGLDFKESIVFVKQKTSINAYSMIDGSLISKLSVSQNINVITPTMAEKEST